MKALIIGGGGFVGKYLANHLYNDCKWNVSVTKIEKENVDLEYADVFDLDILDVDAVKNIIEKVMPDCIFHLAAQSSVHFAWKNPALTIDINIKGAVNLLEAVRSIDGYNPKILLVGSGEEYGHIKESETPVCEENVLRPGNIYAVTKAAQNFIGKIYADAYGMNVIMVRAFNHIGPGQLPNFVISDFCKQVAEIEKDGKGVIRVGNLSAMRDFTDVRDVVRAYSLLVQKGRSGEVYNVGSGKAVSIDEILKMIVGFSKADVTVEVDESKLRPVDVKIIEADVSKLISETGWKRKFELEKTILDTLEFWRENI